MIKIADNVFYCGYKDCNRKLFDQLVPLPQGTTYNSFLVIGSEKIALIDTIFPPNIPNLIEQLEENGRKIDYIISNHGEQDHSGALPILTVKFPNAKIVTNEKCKDIIKDMLHVDDDKFIVINDKETLSLGDKTLEFHITPWVHWPDTMFTYVKEDKVLFTCDFLGAHHTHGDVFADNSLELEISAKRYYAEIMMPFRSFCKKYIELIETLNPEIIAPSHGPIYKEPDFIISLYKKWTQDKPLNKVFIPYVSMYESSKLMAEHLAQRLNEAGIEVVMSDLIHTDEGEVAMELVDCATVVLACSMVLAAPHPKAVYGAYLINLLRPKFKYFSIIGSYGWGGKLAETIDGILNIIKPEKLGYVIIKGRPRKEDYKLLDELAFEIVQKHKTL